MCHGELDEPDTFVGRVSPFDKLRVTRFERVHFKIGEVSSKSILGFLGIL
jgi:hypothetical protein